MAVEASPAPAQTAPANTALETGQGTEEEARWRPVLGLPCELNVELPLPGFTVADFMKLRNGSVINAHWQVSREVPLRLNGRLIAWCEFEVVGDSLAVRMTELA